MPGEKNLIPMDQRSEDEARELGRQGGIASGAARRRKRALKEAADLYLSLPVSDRRKWNALARRGIDPEDIDNQMAMIAGLTDAAAGGDARAGRLIVDILGEEAGGAKETQGQSTDIQALADLLAHPAPDRKLEDFETLTSPHPFRRTRPLFSGAALTTGSMWRKGASAAAKTC